MDGGLAGVFSFEADLDFEARLALGIVEEAAEYVDGGVCDVWLGGDLEVDIWWDKEDCGCAVEEGRANALLYTR